MGNIRMQCQLYTLSVTFNVFRQMTISPKVGVLNIEPPRRMAVVLGFFISYHLLFCNLADCVPVLPGGKYKSNQIT